MSAETKPPAALSVDTDLLAEYARFYGQPAASDDSALFAGAVVRGLELLEEHHAPATFFVIGRHLRTAAGRAAVRRIVEAGHEVANHTDTHPFGFARLDRHEREREIRTAHQRIAEATGVEPRGFRSPSFAASPDTADLLAEMGYSYDASLLPTWAHLPMRWMQRRRSSTPAEGFGSASAMFASRRPHRIRTSGSEIYALPAAVTPWLRLPFTHTVSLHLGRPWIPRLARMFSPREPIGPYVFHLVDFLDFEQDELPSWMSRHPGATRPIEYKRAAADEALRHLRHGRRLTDLSTYLEALRPA